MNRPSHRGCDRVCAAPGITRRLLASTDLGVAAIAAGYDAEEALSRAFKRAYGTSPANSSGHPKFGASVLREG